MQSIILLEDCVYASHNLNRCHGR